MLNSSGESVRSERGCLPLELNFLAPSAVDPLIRIGRDHDGGYVIPAFCASNAQALVSFGVSTDWSFEEQFRRLHPQIAIQTYDHTVSERIFKRAFDRGIVKFALGRASARDLRERFRLWRSYREFLSAGATHFEERICDRSGGAGEATLDTVFARTGSRRIFLKVDIEGSEYGIIEDILKYADRIVGVVMEFHDTDRLRDRFCASVKALQRRFAIVHLHGNNYGRVSRDNLPDVLEITFVESGRARGTAKRSVLPLPDLDFPNNPTRRDYELRFSV